MVVDKVLVKKALKMGNGSVVMPGTIYPNPSCPDIPREIRLEIKKQRGTVEVLSIASTAPATAETSVEDTVKTVLEASISAAPALTSETTVVEKEVPEGQIDAVVEPEVEPAAVTEPAAKHTHKHIDTPAEDAEQAKGKAKPAAKRTRKVITTTK